MKLPAAPWTQRASLKALIAALDGAQGATRIVGGAVRDTILDLPVKDIDLATRLLPDQVMARLDAAAIKAVPTGIDHGTITAVTADGNVEITTLRRDVSTDGRRATVAFSEDWQDDAARRDFTINALFADPETLEITDFFGGLDDLDQRHIRFIGSAEQRIAEDHLRIMRYFRFLARFGQDQVEAEAFQACVAAAASLKSLSRERIADELLKLLATDNPCFAVEQMVRADIFAHIVSAIDPEAPALLHRLIAREQADGLAPSAIRRLIALLPKDPKMADKIVSGLRFSKKMRKAVAARLVALQPVPKDMPALAYHHGREAAQDIALLFADDNQLSASRIALEDWEKPVFPITGGDLVQMGLEPGPIVAQRMDEIEAAWIAEGFPDENRVRALAKQFLEKDHP